MLTRDCFLHVIGDCLVSSRDNANHNEKKTVIFWTWVISCLNDVSCLKLLFYSRECIGTKTNNSFCSISQVKMRFEIFLGFLVRQQSLQKIVHQTLAKAIKYFKHMVMIHTPADLTSATWGRIWVGMVSDLHIFCKHCMLAIVGHRL